jgi:hypothetical protein
MKSVVRSVSVVSRLSTVSRTFATAAKKSAKATKASGAAASGSIPLESLIARARHNDDLNNVFGALDKQGQKDVSIQSELPVTVTGPHAPYVEAVLTLAKRANSKNPYQGMQQVRDDLVKVNDIISAADYSINRFFFEPDYLPKETVTAVGLLTTDIIPLKDFKAIKDVDLRDYFLVNEDMMKQWAAARKAISSAKVGDSAQKLLLLLAKDGNTHMLREVIGSVDEVLTVVSP